MTPRSTKTAFHKLVNVTVWGILEPPREYNVHLQKRIIKCPNQNQCNASIGLIFYVKSLVSVPSTDFSEYNTIFFPLKTHKILLAM